MNYTKYYYKGISLRRYALTNNLNYDFLIRLIRRHLTINNLEKTIDEYVKVYLTKKEKAKIRECLINYEHFSRLEVCKVLKINYKSICNKIYKGFDEKLLIILTWSHYDKLNKKGEKILSLKKLNSINHDNIYDLIFLYKSGSDCLMEILNYESKYYKGLINKISAEKNLVFNKSIQEDLVNELNLNLLKLIPKIYYNTPGQVINYIRKSLSYRLLDYVNKNYSKTLSLNIEIYKNEEVNEFDF